MISICQNADIVSAEAVWIAGRINGLIHIQIHKRCHDLLYMLTIQPFSNSKRI
jgi:hypothetical protein